MFGGGVPSTTGLIPSDIEISGNDISKPIAWRNPDPGAARVGARCRLVPTGSLAAGTHYFKVVAVMLSSRLRVWSPCRRRKSRPQLPRDKRVALSWTASAGAETYRIYHGTSAGGEAKYMTTTGSATSFVYTGTGESAGQAPTPAHDGCRRISWS